MANVEVLEGAARYVAQSIPTKGGEYPIIMHPSDGSPTSIIDHKSTLRDAIKCAYNWQKKENKEIAKSKRT